MQVNNAPKNRDKNSDARTEKRTTDLFDVVIVGAGPVGLTVLDVLLRQNLGLRIGLFSPEVDKSQHAKLTVNGNPLKKDTEEKYKKLSQTFTWGTACLPFPKGSIALPESYWRWIEELTKRMKVDAVDDELKSIYPITGEKVDTLERKFRARRIVSSNHSNVVMGHSRLAIHTSGDRACTFQGNCFVGCPKDSPWHSGHYLNELVSQYPEQFTVMQKEVAQIAELSSDLVRVVTSDNRYYRANNVVLAAGWRETETLLQSLESNNENIKSILYGTPVVLLPILFWKKSELTDFENSFQFHDIFCYLKGDFSRNFVTAQLYLPTEGLASRLHQILEAKFRFLPAFFRKIIFQIMRRRFGVAMVFMGETSITDEYSLTRSALSHIAWSLTKAITIFEGLVFTLGKQSISPSDSHHVGHSSRLEHIVTELLDENIITVGTQKRIHAVGPHLLPFIPSGPHTISACAMSAIYVEKVLIPKLS